MVFAAEAVVVVAAAVALERPNRAALFSFAESVEVLPAINETKWLKNQMVEE